MAHDQRSWKEAILSLIPRLPKRREIIDKDEVAQLLYFIDRTVWLDRVEISQKEIRGLFSPDDEVDCRGKTSDGTLCMSRQDIEEMAIQLVMIVALRHGNFSVVEPGTLAQAQETYLGPQWRFEGEAKIGHRVEVKIDPKTLHRFPKNHQLQCGNVKASVGHKDLARFSDILVQVFDDKLVDQS